MAIDDAFINPELDLQLHQADIGDGAGYEAVLLKTSISNANSSVENMVADTQAVAALEAMAEFIKDRKVDKTSAILFNVATESYGNLNNLKDSRIAFAMESISNSDEYLSDTDKEIALENIAHNTMYVMDKLSTSLQNTILSVGDLVHSFDRNHTALKKRINALELLVADLDHREEMVYNYVKPDKQFVHLMYTHSGSSKGIDPVLDDVSWLFKEHSDMVVQTIKKYKDWYNSNKSDIDNSEVFNSLRYDPKDFILTGSTVFNKSVGTKTPSKGSVFYRTKELPGGVSFYSEIHNSVESKTAAINALMDISYFLDYYEPDSFRVKEKRLYTAAALGLLTWASVMVANPLPLAFSGFVNSSISDSTKTQDVKKVRITEDTTFPTLSRDAIKDTLNKLKAISLELQEWNEEVYTHTWKDKHVKDMLSELSNTIKESGYTNGNVKHFRDYAISMVSIMSKSYTKLHSYGFEVLNAALSYAEKSARQYR